MRANAGPATLSQTKASTWSSHFDAERAAHVCRFVEMQPHIKGR